MARQRHKFHSTSANPTACTLLFFIPYPPLVNAQQRGKKWNERHGLIIRLGKALTWNAVLDKGVGRGWRKNKRFWRKLEKAGTELRCRKRYCKNQLFCLLCNLSKTNKTLCQIILVAHIDNIFIQFQQYLNTSACIIFYRTVREYWDFAFL